MKTFLRYALLTLLWSSVAAYIIYAGWASRDARAGRKVRRVEIEIVDSTSRGHLVSTGMVRSWIRQSGIPTIGARVDAVDLAGIEQLIARNGFVDRVVAYTSYSGELRIRISQHKPLVRLLSGGLNSYVTAEGYVFTAPRQSSLYVPVVSGSYDPPFPVDYTGGVCAHTADKVREIDRRIAELEGQKYPFYKRELQNDRNILALRRMRVKRQWWRLESTREFEACAEELRKRKVKLRRDYRYEARLIQAGIDTLAEQQQSERRKQKKLEKSSEDFMKLLTFVGFVEDDDFWRSEVVQIVAHTTPSNALEVELVPRSGGHTVLFGRIEQVERKFDKLLHFYRNALTGIGWREYRTIDIRYNDQVVCKK